MRERSYHPDRDFLRVRDFLSQTFQAFGRTLNWRIERWNYARYFISPMLGAFGTEEEGIVHSREVIRTWEELTRVWETEGGEVAGVVTLEHPTLDHPGYGEVFLQRHPDHLDLLEEMLEYAEQNLVNPSSNQVFIYAYEDDVMLRSTLETRGYQGDETVEDWDSEFRIVDMPEITLPDSFEFRSMAQDNDIENRREVFGRAFNHPDPQDWPSAFSYQELQRAPDYQKDLDLYILAPNGKHVAFCLVWYDARNRLASLEPVGTHPDYQRLGLGRAVVLEGIRRVATLGAERVQVGSGQRFYQALGFRRIHRSFRWTKQLE